MDPISMIVAALVAGAAAGAGEGARDTVRASVVSLYRRLKAALVARAGDDQAAGKALERHATNPQGYEAPVRDLVVESSAADDARIVALARELLAAADPAGAQTGKYVVRVTSSQGVQVGKHNTQTNTFGPIVSEQVSAGRDVNTADRPNVDHRTTRG
ncbi:MAG TPA: hypothetical protein VFC00_34645 [Micromonosporaceae bacterium]|nr:hypothetical protein [Micromonosporaceae bacterium]